MQTIRNYPVLGALFILTACVTINVYFPAAAAENAADRIIEEVYGEDETQGESEEDAVDARGARTTHTPVNFLLSLLQGIIPAAQAQQPDINISTPGINKLKSLMKQHHNELSGYYESGAVGMESNGLIVVRDAKAIPLKERNQVKKLVNDENNARTQLYREIATANGHPEWETEIRQTFARRWIALAPAGWWYNDSSGNWQQK